MYLQQWWYYPAYWFIINHPQDLFSYLMKQINHLNYQISIQSQEHNNSTSDHTTTAITDFTNWYIHRKLSQSSFIKETKQAQICFFTTQQSPKGKSTTSKWHVSDIPFENLYSQVKYLLLISHLTLHLVTELTLMEKKETKQKSKQNIKIKMPNFKH